jgi:hypothetical protein
LLAETGSLDIDERVSVQVVPVPGAGGRCFVALRGRSTGSSAEPAKRTAMISSRRARKPSAESPVANGMRAGTCPLISWGHHLKIEKAGGYHMSTA